MKRRTINKKICDYNLLARISRNTIKGRIFKYNLAVILLLITITTITFNVAIRLYIQKEIIGQLNKLATSVEGAALEHGPDFFKPDDNNHTPPNLLPRHATIPETSSEVTKNSTSTKNNDLFRYYFMLDRSLRKPLSVLSADFILIDKNKNAINPSTEESNKIPSDLLSKLKSEIDTSSSKSYKSSIRFSVSGTDYVAIVRPVSDKNTFGLGWIIIYSSVQKINQLQFWINIILLIILIISALITVIFSSRIAKKISEPFSSLNEHIRSIAERNFGEKIDLPVDYELSELVNGINIMSEKLEIYDKAQKTFLQNVSHEFRTPLMSIQSYAEGIKYEVVDGNSAADIIIGESKRLTHLVEDLLYLSRLDSIEENYNYTEIDFIELINSCAERLNAIALKSNIKISVNNLNKDIIIYSDEEKLSRALTNIISNSIRYASSSITVVSNINFDNKLDITISDDGPGFDEKDLPHIFDRFYKGKKGKFGLGLSISKNIIEKLHGTITAGNGETGALFSIEIPIKCNSN
ncbi:HAMP domain-containing sensor histidine kinase [Clostridium sp. DMHC 10]|uniref:sensor histidine kinase n=1 Tax=Clostridium sp. DMHC 10 TaxID=747377 RepID=UPI000A4409C0|nr:HAMP domain-containing sensor histidine kinase [Clostridium sp. DMHC 10]